LLVLNPFYFVVRLAAGIAAAGRGMGDTAHFPGLRGKLTMACGLVCGDLQALRLAPRMLRKRSTIAQIRKLTSGEVRRLILAHRLSLREVA